MVNNNEIIVKDFIAKYQALLLSSRNAIGIIAVELFNESFSKQGKIMGNGRVSPWANRVHNSPGQRRSLLIQSGRLRRSINYRVTGKTTIQITSNTPYSVLQNEGGTIQVTAGMRRFFWAMYYKYAGKVVYSVKTREPRQTKANLGHNKEAEYWFSLALAKQITIKPRPFIYDTPELWRRIDVRLVKAIDNIKTSIL